jgi:hypothetical protein
MNIARFAKVVSVLVHPPLVLVLVAVSFSTAQELIDMAKLRRIHQKAQSGQQLTADEQAPKRPRSLPPRPNPPSPKPAKPPRALSRCPT